MRASDLSRYGMPDRVIELWHAAGFKHLLPLQVEAVQQYGLLDGDNLLVLGPTSSGKTFCGEIAALRAIFENKKAIILVPFKAIAEEKYNDLRKRYAKLGLKILILNRDYPYNKKKFINGKYDIAIIVYEMFASLTASHLRALESVGAVIFDEFQMISGKKRGLIIESVLAKVRYLSAKIQLVALIGGLHKCSIFRKWLDIPLLSVSGRPVELHRGVLLRSQFNYKRYNDLSEGVEYLNPDKESFPAFPDLEPSREELFKAVAFLLKNNEQILIFTSTRRACRDLAQALAELFKLSEAERTLDCLHDYPETMQKTLLAECLRKGIAFHNGDFSLAYRRLLEKGFREGEIRVMVCTSTLAMGVNLPSRNVFIEPQKYYDASDGTAILKPLMLDDYNQVAGRAGRLGKGDSFGRAVIIAADDNDRKKIRECYINSTGKPDIELFDFEQLAWLALSMICCGIIKDYKDIKDQLKLTLRGFIDKIETQLPSRIIDFLTAHGFMNLKGCRLYCTALGKAAVTHGIELDTAALIKDGFAGYKLNHGVISWLYYLTEFPECRSNLLFGRRINFGEVIDEYLKTMLYKNDEVAAGPLQVLLENPDFKRDPARLYTLMMLIDIMQPLATIELEGKYNVGWGRLKDIGEFCGNLLRAVAEIGEVNGLKRDQVEYLEEKAECLHYGVPEKGLPLARLMVNSLERDFILCLNNADLFTPEDIVNRDYDQLATLLPDWLSESLYKRCLNQVQSREECDNQERGTGNNRMPLKARKAGTNYVVTINNEEVILQPALYKYFIKLYNAAHPEGWIDKNQLDTGLNQVKYIYKLRRILENAAGMIIESDGAGRYRLVLDNKTLSSERVDSPV